ncbi:FtsX-like permease family protein [Streptomyces katsurahamanus]|uniref:FtsX-like permease family protein n=1 Tax=Streptomyces katsurahamanus TaxID=2577098 RepID=UPI002B20B609|nr:FtsX-like permease family protein [Streptomyces katsurahamanus]
MNAVQLLSARFLRAHRTAWAAVFTAVALTSALLGASALTIGSAALGHAETARYAAADVVVAGDQSTRHTTEQLGGGTETAHAALTERVRLPERTAAVLRAVPGVRDAIADEVFPVRVERGGAPGRTVDGRPWAAARLAPHELTAGRAPRGAGEVVVGAGLGTRVGGRMLVRASAGAGDRGVRAYRVTGTATGPAHLWFAAAEARRLAGRPGSAAAIGVLAEPGVSAAEAHSRVRRALDRAGIRDVAAGRPVRAYTGEGRGAAEHLGAAAARRSTVEMFAAVSGTVLMISVLVIGSLVAQALRQRAPELALLRSVGATPRRIRAVVGREVIRVAAVAALLGAVAAIPAQLALRAWLRSRGVLPEGLVLPAPWWLFPATVLTAGLTVGVARLVVPFARPGESGGAARPGNGRRITGLVLLAGGVGAAGGATLQSGQAAAMAASTAAVTMVVGCALLGPWIAAGALRVLGGPLRRAGGPAGRLAAAASTANAARFGAAITPLVLMTAFAGVQLSAGATVQRAGDLQAERAFRAGFAVTGADAARLGGVPGVAVATDVLHSTVVLAGSDLGTPRLERLPVLGVTPRGLTRTLDPGVTAGNLDALRGRGTVAVGEDRADALGIGPGSAVTLRMGDGAERRLKVAAVYRNALALGDFLFSREELSRHMSSPLPSRVLISPERGVDPAAVRTRIARLAGVRVDSSPPPERLTSEDHRAGAALSLVAVASIGALTAVTVLTTLALITTGRRGEFALLRRVGAGRGQLRWMLRAEAAAVTLTGLTVGAAVALVPLTAFSLTAADTLPYLPAPHLAAIAAATTLTAFAGVLLPGRASLRARA